MEEKKIDLELLIDLLTVDKLDLTTALLEAEIDEIDEEEIIELLEEKNIYKCEECGTFDNEEDMEKVLSNKICEECVTNGLFEDEEDEDEEW